MTGETKKGKDPMEQKLQLEERHSGDPEEDPSDRANSTFCKCLANKITTPVCALVIIIALGVLVVTALVALSVIASLYSIHRGSAVVLSLGPPAGPWCPDGWIGYQGKCYYFSEAKENWNNSRSNCSALGASLAVIDSEQEKTFLLRCKGKLDHWLGLWRKQDQDQPWKWANGTEFNNQFEIRGGGHCAYLSDGFVGSSRCSSLTNWICSKHDAYTMGKGTAQPGI
ncbi:C-type lectin domain family 2 member D-like [Malaclemys terrapin pileata]|uniref:C-type lectin domain family 2 member D-like n=1 Tax=Malaclemys terrapin pileata TaxID=2991368 RepID=UPI0023A80CDA|nr:C-type lectin domain family 2 member D-like [Malaclemys terrapin pileata]